MMAAARAAKGEAAAPASPKTAPAKPAAAKPIPAKPAAAEKPSPKAAPDKVATPKGAAAPKGTASILAAARTAEKPGPMTKAAAAAKPQPVREGVAAAKAKLTVPPMPVKPAYASVKPGKSEKQAGIERRGFMSLLFGSFLGLGFTSLTVTTGLMTLGTARFMFPNTLTEPPNRFKVGPPDTLVARTSGDEIQSCSTPSGSSTTSTRGARRFSRSSPSARIWAALPIGSRGSKSSNAPVTAAGITRMASISRAPPRGRSSGMRSISPTTGNWKLTRARRFTKNSANGPIRLRSCRCESRDGESAAARSPGGSRLNESCEFPRPACSPSPSPLCLSAKRSAIRKFGRVSFGIPCRWIVATASW